jgi:hypothetical protein
VWHIAAAKRKNGKIDAGKLSAQVLLPNHDSEAWESGQSASSFAP